MFTYWRLALEGLIQRGTTRCGSTAVVERGIAESIACVSCAGKGRDALGREVIDPVLVGSRGNYAREMNERSPRNSPRRSSSRERRAAKELANSGRAGAAAEAAQA